MTSRDKRIQIEGTEYAKYRMKNIETENSRM